MALLQHKFGYCSDRYSPPMHDCVTNDDDGNSEKSIKMNTKNNVYKKKCRRIFLMMESSKNMATCSHTISQHT